jgi:hypothetical protein
MFIEMLYKTWPRSWRAAAALLVMLGALSAAYDALIPILMPGPDGILVVFQFIAGTILGLAAAGYFYYYQTVDDEPPGLHKHLETLNNAHVAEEQRKRIEGAKATPVFSSHHGEIKRPD